MGNAAVLALCLVFLAAAVTKINKPSLTAESIADYELLPAGFVKAAAIVMPAFEASIAVTLLGAPWAGALAAFVALAFFSGVVLLAMRRGKTDISCGCFGQAGDAPIGWHVIVRNVGLLSLAAIAGMTRKSIALPSMAGVLAVALVLLLVWLVTEYIRLLENISRAASPLRRLT